MIQKISLLLKTDGLIPIDDSLIFQIKKPDNYWRWEDPVSAIASYKNTSDLLFIKQIIALDFVEKDISFISDFDDFEYRAQVIRESEKFSLHSFWCRSKHNYWKLYKIYAFDSEDDCFDQMIADFNFLEKRNILEAFKNDQ
jgi:hypothetical protein